MPVVVHQPSRHSMIGGTSTRPNSHLCLSVFTLLLVNPLFGLVALIFSLLSRSAAALDWESARIKGRISMFISVTGIIISIIVGVIMVLIFFTKDA